MSNATFKKRNLANHRALITGLDEAGVQHQTVLDTEEWDLLTKRTGFTAAIEEYDAKVAEFFKPLTEAADRLENAHKIQTDPAFYVVEQEGVQSTDGQPELLHFLSHDSVVIRLIEGGREDRLVWVGDDIEILEDAPEDFKILEDAPEDIEVVAPYDVN